MTVNPTDVDPADVEPQDANEPEGPQPESAYGCPVGYSHKQRVLYPSLAHWGVMAAALLEDGWNMCVDITAVDYLGHAGSRSLPEGVTAERFEVVANFVSHSTKQRLRARVQVPEADPAIDSLHSTYPGTDTSEREIYDLMGIRFDGHPDLSRILMPETWEGHPLRKDYAVGAIPVQFKDAPAAGRG